MGLVLLVLQASQGTLLYGAGEGERIERRIDALLGVLDESVADPFAVQVILQTLFPIVPSVDHAGGEGFPVHDGIG